MILFEASYFFHAQLRNLLGAVQDKGGAQRRISFQRVVCIIPFNLYEVLSNNLVLTSLVAWVETHAL